MTKPKVAVYKFTSCDGCQLAFLSAGEDLLALADRVEITFFSEAGILQNSDCVDIAFVEGSVSTPEQVEKIQHIRAHTQYLITIGACATAGGIQALRNVATVSEWVSAIYAHPEHIQTLETSTAIAKHVLVDFELWGCPVNTQQVMDAINSLLLGAKPTVRAEKVCIECKRRGYTCVMVAKQQPCMGPVTQTGCGALCPAVGRGCYGCYGPSENANTHSFGDWLQYLGCTSSEISKKFLQINSQTPTFQAAGNHFYDKIDRH